MAGQRQPGSWGLAPTSVRIDEGTSARIRTPPPGSTGEGSWNNSRQRAEVGVSVVAGAAAETVESVNQALARFRQSENWSRLQPVVFQVVGQYSFGLGVVYGIGENVIGSVVELGQLAKTFLLADLYDRAQQSVLTAAFGPTAMVQRLVAEVAMRTFGGELEEARREREELIAEVRYAMTNLGEVFDTVKAGYVAKWNRFETLSRERTLSAQFEAGRIFGEVLLEGVSLIAGGAAALKVASKMPRLAKLARLRIPPKSAPRAKVAGGTAAGEKPVTPSHVRGPEPDIPEPASKPRPAPEADPPEILKRRQDHEKLLKSDRFKEDLMETVPELKEFSDKWGKVLGRDVNFVGRTAPTLPSPAPSDFRL
jgi:hypothetical protein